MALYRGQTAKLSGTKEVLQPLQAALSDAVFMTDKGLPAVTEMPTLLKK